MTAEAGVYAPATHWDGSHKTPRPLLGIALVIAAACAFTVMDTTVRCVGSYFSVARVLVDAHVLHAAIMTL